MPTRTHVCERACVCPREVVYSRRGVRNMDSTQGFYHLALSHLFPQNIVQSCQTLHPSGSPSVLAKPTTLCFLSMNLNIHLVMRVNSYSFFLHFHSFFNYQFQCDIHWNLSNLRGLKWELPPLCSHSTWCILLLWPAVHQNPGGWLFPEGSFWRHRSHLIFLCIIGAKPVFGIAVGILCRLVDEWLDK